MSVFDDFNEKEYRSYLQIKNSLSKDWKYVGYGRHRKVYKRNGVVLKVPYTPGGAKANQDEYLLYRKVKSKRFAPCRLLKNGCLMMLAVNPIDECDPVQAEHIPKWAWDLEDGPQIGFRKSKILIYDYADEIDNYDI